MLSFNRRLFLLGSAATTLGGCGFTPVYGTTGQASQLQNTILVDAPKTRPAYRLTEELEDRLGRAENPRYGLSYMINLNSSPVAIGGDNVTVRQNLMGEITYALRNLSSKAILTTGKVSSFTGYSSSGTTVAAQTAEIDAERRLMVILADHIVTRLIAAAPGLPA